MRWSWYPYALTASRVPVFKMKTGMSGTFATLSVEFATSREVKVAYTARVAAGDVCSVEETWLSAR